jgi:hypothetical protein
VWRGSCRRGTCWWTGLGWLIIMTRSLELASREWPMITLDGYIIHWVILERLWPRLSKIDLREILGMKLRAFSFAIDRMGPILNAPWVKIKTLNNGFWQCLTLAYRSKGIWRLRHSIPTGLLRSTEMMVLGPLRSRAKPYVKIASKNSTKPTAATSI